MRFGSRKFKPLTLKGRIRIAVDDASSFIKYNIVWPITRPFEKAIDFVRYRTYDRYTVINTGLEPGYYDKDTLLLNVNFQLLADFVENECAFMELCFNKEKRKKLSHKLYFILPRPLDRFFRIRDRQIGLNYINWQADHILPPEERVNMGLEDDAKFAEYTENYSRPWKEIRTLYLWWRDTRPARPDYMDASGWSEWCDRKRQQGKDILDAKPCAWDNDGVPTLYESMNNNTPWEEKEQRRILDETHRIEKEQEDEDTDMLTRLIKVRHSLWT